MPVLLTSLRKLVLWRILVLLVGQALDPMLF